MKQRKQKEMKKVMTVVLGKEKDKRKTWHFQ